MPRNLRNETGATLTELSRSWRRYSQMRNISHQLHPSILDDLGLVAALRSMAENFESGYSRPTRVSRRTSRRV